MVNQSHILSPAALAVPAQDLEASFARLAQLPMRRGTVSCFNDLEDNCVWMLAHSYAMARMALLPVNTSSQRNAILRQHGYAGIPGKTPSLVSLLDGDGNGVWGGIVLPIPAGYTPQRGSRNAWEVTYLLNSDRGGMCPLAHALGCDPHTPLADEVARDFLRWCRERRVVWLDELSSRNPHWMGGSHMFGQGIVRVIEASQ